MQDDDVRGLEADEPRRVFGQLTLIRPTGERIRGLTVYECRCSCGNLDKATISLLLMGRKTSCGCQNRSKSGASKAKSLEVERLKELVTDSGRPLGEIAAEAGLTESQVMDGLNWKRQLTLAATAALLKTLGKHWSDLDEPDHSFLESTPRRNPLPRGELGILPNGARPRHLTALLSRNRFEPPRWPTEGRTWAVPLTEGDGLSTGSELF